MTQLINSAPASGSGSVTIAAPVTNSNQTLTLPDETGTVVTSASPVRTQKGVPAFSAYQSVAQSVPSNTWTKIQFQSEEYDLTSAFDSTTNYRFQPTVAGYYQIVAGVNMVSTTAANSQIAVYKNGSQYKVGYGPNSSIGVDRPSVAAQAYLNGTTDYLEIYGNIATGQNTTAGQALTYFQGILIAAA